MSIFNGDTKKIRKNCAATCTELERIVMYKVCQEKILTHPSSATTRKV